MDFTITFHIIVAILFTSLVFSLIISFIFIRLYRSDKQSLKQQKLLDSILSATPDFVYLLDLETGNYLYTNRDLATWLGYSAEDIIQTRQSDWLRRFVHPDDTQLYHAHLQNIKQESNPTEKMAEYRLIGKDGSARWICNRMMAFAHNAEGEVTQVVGWIQDITAQKQAEEKDKNLLQAPAAIEEQSLSHDELRQNLQVTLEFNRKLMESEASLAEAQRITQLGSWEWHPSTNITIWSDQLFRNYGLEPQSVTPTQDLFYSIVHPDDLPKSRNILTNIFQNPQPYEWEYRIVRPDGQIRVMHAKGDFIFDEKGNLQKIYGTCQDITERKQTDEQIQVLLREAHTINEELATSEEALREMLETTLELNKKLRLNEAWLAQTQQTARLGSWEFDLGRQTITWSQETYRLFGMEPGGPVPTYEEYLSKIHPDDQEKIAQAVKQAIEEGKPYQLEIRHVLPDGDIRWMLVVGKPMLDDAGQVIKLMGVSLDIHERKVTEEALRESETRYRSLVELLPDAVVITCQGVIIYSNVSASKVFSIGASEELLGKSILNYIHPDFHELTLRNWQEKVQGQETLPIEIKIIRPDGHVFDAEANGTILTINGLIGTLILIRDITERKAAEEQLKQQNQELRKINAELDRFVYRASHDLRAPLASLLGLITITKLESSEASKERYFQMMEKSVAKLDTFIQSIINYSRNARLEVTRKPIDFRALVQETFDDLRYMERSEEIDKQLDIRGESDFFSDLFRLKIIFSNIISNAIRYSNPQVASFIRISITVDEHQALLEFEDNGCGIAPENINKIFEMFYRASQDKAGSGLGLYIVAEVIQALKGRIQVQSELGKGTRFIVHIPNLPIENQVENIRSE